MTDMFRRFQTPGLLSLVLIAGVLLLLGIGSPILVRVGVGALISVVLVVGLFVFIGNSGILSFGHLGFSAVAAYVTAWLTMRPPMKAMMLPGLPEFLQQAQWPLLPAALASGLAAGLVGLFSGVFIMRMSGIAASIATFAFAAIINTVYANSDSVTGGVGSLAGIPTGLPIWGVLLWAIAALFLAHAFSISAYGLALRATREDEVAAKASGIRVFRVRLAAWVLSAFVCGIAGNLQARYLGVISPDSFYLGATFLALTMLIVGGVSSLTGAVAGAVLVSAVMEALIRLEGQNFFGLPTAVPPGTANFLIAILLCFVLVKRPKGLVGEEEMTLPKALARRGKSQIENQR
jgi:branched-chain amino acid transport system permease protein